MRASPRLATLLCVAFLFALPFVLFAPVTLGDKTLIPADVLYQYEPFAGQAAQLGVGKPQNDLLADLVLENWIWKSFALQSLRNGELPLWNPHLFAGVPFLAAGQHSMLYPPSVLYVVLPLEKAYGWYTVVNLAIAGACMFAFMRTLRVRRAAALFAAVAYEFSGFMVVSVVFQMIIGAAAWLPLILAMCERVIQRWPGLRGRPSSAPWAILGAFALAMLVLAGHVEIVVYTGLVTAAYCAWRLAAEWRAGRGGGRWLLVRLAWLAALAALGLGLGAVQLVPLAELVSRNFRGAGRSTFEQVLSYGFPPREALNWLMPNFFGNPAHHAYFDVFSLSWQAVNTATGHTHWGVKNYVEGGAYVGLITLAFAALAVGRWARGLRRPRPPGASGTPVGFFVVLSVFSIAFIFGTPLYAILYYGLPGINQLHSPFRWIFPLTLCLAVLGGLGVDWLASRVGGRLPRPVRVAAWTGLAASAALALGLAAARLAWPAAEPLVARALAGLLNADQAFTGPGMFFSYQARNIGLFALALAGACAIALLGARRWAPLLAVGVLALDLSIAWTGFNPAVDPALLYRVPEAARFLQADTSQWRMTSFTPGGTRPFHANVPWLFGLQDVRGYDSIIPKQYVDYMKLIELQNELLYNRVGPLFDPGSLQSPLLDLLGVKYVATQDTIATPGFTQVWSDGRLRIYRNERALPRAFTLPQDSALLTHDFAQAVQSNNPTQFVMIDANCGITDTGCVVPRAGTPRPAAITSYRNLEVWVDAQIDEPSWLILTDSYFPGWRAFVRPKGAPDSAEREVIIGLVNGNFRAVKLDLAQPAAPAAPAAPAFGGAPGLLGAQPPAPAKAEPQAFTVRFRYSPDSVRLGVLGTLVAGMAALLAAAAYVWRSVAGAQTDATGVRRVFRNSLILTAVNIAARLIDFAFATLMLRVLGPEGAGNYAFAVVIVSWFEIFMNFGLNTYLTREVARDRTRAEAHFFTTSALRLMLGGAALPVVAVVAALSGTAGPVGWAIVLLTLSQLPSSLSTGISALFFAYERAEVPAALTLVTALLKVAIGTLALLGGLGVIGLALTSIAVNVITLVVLAVSARRTLGVRWERALRPGSRSSSSRTDMLRDSFPLMLNHLLATLFFKIDVPLLQGLRGATVVGWYSTAYKFVDAFNVIPAFFTQSLFPAMSRMAAQRDAADDPLARAFRLAVKLLVMVSLPVAVATTYLAEWMVGVLGGREYLPAGEIALMIMIWSIPIGWINSVTNYALIAVGRQRALTRAFLIGLGFNVVANLIAIPLFSYAGAAFVTILSEIVEGAAFYVYVRRHIVKLDWVAVLARPALAAGVMAAVVYPFAAAGLPAIGIAIGLPAYAATLVAARALSPDERAVLAPLLPGRVRRALMRGAGA